jgi:acetyl esterase/lipase
MYKKINILGIMIMVLTCLACQQEDPVLGENAAVNYIDESYGSDPRQKMDVYLPANRSAATTKVLVWIHGGAWADGNKSEFAGFKPWLEEVQDDYAYIALNYRLFDFNNNRNGFPSQEEDIQAALRHIQSKLASWNISNKIVLAGGSAGGHLALLHSYKHNSDGLIRAAVAFFPPTEMTAFYSHSFLTQLLLPGLLGGTPSSIPEVYRNSSPVRFVSPTSVPTIFFHGTVDTVVPISQSQLLEAELVKANVQHEKEYIPNQGHGFDEATNRRLIKKIADFLDQHVI